MVELFVAGAVAGHDIKIGRGGIREIEFFVQTQQLVFGGRKPALRGRRTVAMRDGRIAFEHRTAGRGRASIARTDLLAELGVGAAHPIPA